MGLFYIVDCVFESSHFIFFGESRIANICSKSAHQVTSLRARDISPRPENTSTKSRSLDVPRAMHVCVCVGGDQSR